MLSQQTLQVSSRPWTISRPFHGIDLQFSGDRPPIQFCAENFLRALEGPAEDAPRERLAFFLNPIFPEQEHSSPSGSKTPIQFSEVSCFQEDGWFHFYSKNGSLIQADVQTGRALGYLSKEFLEAKAYVFNDLLMAPLMEMLKYRGFYGLHAAALAKKGQGYLFPADGGNGKTTIALSLLKQGFQCLGDDKVLLREGNDSITALSFSRRFNIDPHISEFYQELRFLEGLQPLPGCNKRPVDISQVFPQALVSSCHPRYLIYLEKTDLPKSQIYPLSSQASFKRLVHHTVLSFLKEVATKQLKLFSDLVKQTDSYLLFSGKDIFGRPERLLELLPCC